MNWTKSICLMLNDKIRSSYVATTHGTIFSDCEVYLFLYFHWTNIQTKIHRWLNFKFNDSDIFCFVLHCLYFLLSFILIFLPRFDFYMKWSQRHIRRWKIIVNSIKYKKPKKRVHLHNLPASWISAIVQFNWIHWPVSVIFFFISQLSNWTTKTKPKERHVWTKSLHVWMKCALPHMVFYYLHLKRDAVL